MEFKIEKGVPVQKPDPGGAPRLYPFAEMEVGDSFVGPKKAAGATSGASKRFSMKFISRKEGDGVRIWRIA